MFWIWKERIAELEGKIIAAQKEILAAQNQGKLLFQHGSKFSKQIEEFFAPQFASNRTELEKYLSNYNVTNVRGWEAEYWQKWEPLEALLNDSIRIGANVESRGDRDFSAPHFAPFIGDNRTLIILSDDRTADDAIALLQSLAIRIALTLPHQSRFTLLDPVGAGSAFPMQKFLPFVRESGDDIRRDLDQVSADIKRIISTYLDAGADSFELLPEDIRVNERLEFILAANYPREYDRRAIEALYSIGRTGPKAGKYLILHYNQSQALPRDMSMDGFENAAYISLDGGYGTLDPTACQLKFVPDRAPSAHLQTELFAKLSKAKPPQRDLAWDRTVALSSDNWWQEKAQVLIETPVGGFGSSELLKVWFGEKGEVTCAHGILGGTAGSGKSTLYHVI